MSDTRAAIRELRSLSEKRGTQGLSEAERERFATLRQRLGLPPEPELATPPASSATERDGAATGPVPQVPKSPPTAGLEAELAQGSTGAQETSPQPMSPVSSDTDRFATISPEEAAPLNGATNPVPDMEPAELTPSEPVGAPASEMNDLAWAGQEGAQPLQLTSESPETAHSAPAELPGFDAAATNDLAWANQEGAQPLQLTSESPEAANSAPAEFAGFDTAATSDLAWTGQQGAEVGAPAFADDAGAAWQSVNAGDAAAWGAEPIPPDAPLPGDLPNLVAEAVAAADDEGPALVLNPEDLGATPLDTEAFAPTPVEPEAGATFALEAPQAPAPALPLDDATRPYPNDNSFDPAVVGADEPIARLSESGPIELSAVDVMLLEEGEAHPGELAGIDVGGDASEPLPLADAAEFVQYQRQDGPSVSLEESGAGEFLQGAEALHASTAELATSPQAYVRPPAAPGIRVPPPPASTAPLPRVATSPSIPAPRAVPSWQPPRPATNTPVPGNADPVPGPPSLRPAPRPTSAPPTAAGFPPPPPLPLPRPPPASLMHPPAVGPTPTPTGGSSRSGRAEPPSPLQAPTPPFPQLTPAVPDPHEKASPQSGPFAPPTLLAAAPLDVMDGFEEQGLPGGAPFSIPAPLPSASPAPPVAAPAIRDTEPTPEPVFGSTFLSPTFVQGEHRVVLHTLEGQVKRGTVCDVDLLDAVIRLNQPGQPQDRIAAERLKAIFFMQAPGESPLPQSGRKVRVHFRDGRQILGFSEDVESTETGFFLIPADTRTHTARIYVFRAGVQSISDG
jgi:hypothetical protein